ncbi:MAG: hypothetical protein JHC26_10825 [Thermofilum sp.]|uniref:hypothetical protein n=1 Tax=Thermofilum sp. TaxID=1961369 RepID=UPI00258C11A9|nr:hypothetical protein [Thermofilum sp.]MCI4409575.1 hypothetical protein [Thermofilum sp.]
MSKETNQKISISDEPGVSIPALGENAIGVEKLADLFFKAYSESKQSKLSLSVECMPYEVSKIQNGKPVKVTKYNWLLYIDIEEGKNIQELKAKIEIVDPETWTKTIKEFEGFHWDVYHKLAELVAKYRPSIIRALLCEWKSVWTGEVNKE